MAVKKLTSIGSSREDGPNGGKGPEYEIICVYLCPSVANFSFLFFVPFVVPQIGWGVVALRSRRFYSFSCSVTCRFGAETGCSVPAA